MIPPELSYTLLVRCIELIPIILIIPDEMGGPKLEILVDELCPNFTPASFSKT